MRGKRGVGKGKFGLPAGTDPVKLADEIKRGMAVKFLKDLEEAEAARIKSRAAGKPARA